MRTVFFGTPEFALESLRQLLESKHQVELVVSRPDKPVGRRKVMTPPPVVEFARKRGLEIFQPSSLKSKEAIARIRSVEADVGVVVAYGRMIPAVLLSAPENGMVNLHPSLLPRHRGPSPIQWALVSGDRRTGVTTMLLDEGMDTGPILLQKGMAIQETDNAESLRRKLASEGAALLVRTLDEMEDGRIEPRPQPETGVSTTPMIRREFGEIEWGRPARQLHNRFRGLSPWPGSYTVFRGGRLKIHGMEVVEPAPPGGEEPGVILGTSPEGILVRCGRGSALLLTELQREGRSRMPADAFLIGERVSPGERLG